MTALNALPEPQELLRAFVRHGAVDWEDPLATAADIADRYGNQATARSLRLLEQLIAIEPRVTAEFLAAVPEIGAPYQLTARVKSPESLARKLAEQQDSRRWSHAPVDLLRYTVLTEVPDKLVAAARQTADELRRTGWQVTSAMQSYTDGSRYKGIHAVLKTPTADQAEVQFHSVASAKVKELTRPYYEVERSPQTTVPEKKAARRESIRLSATLAAPAGIDGLTELAGQPVLVKNYSDHWQATGRRTGQAPGQDGPAAASPTRAARENGMGK